MKELNNDDKIGDIKNANNNNNNEEEHNNNMNNFNDNNNFGQNQFGNYNAFQDDYGGLGGESEEDILKRVLELSKKEF